MCVEEANDDKCRENHPHILNAGCSYVTRNPEMTQIFNFRPPLPAWILPTFMLVLTACLGPRIDDAGSIDSGQETGVPATPPPEPVKTPAQVSEILQRAELELGLALEIASEWMIHENSVSSQPVSLSELLLAAQQHFENDNHPEGERLALLVSEFAKLALEQHMMNRKYLLNGKNLYSQ